MRVPSVTAYAPSPRVSPPYRLDGSGPPADHVHRAEHRHPIRFEFARCRIKHDVEVVLLVRFVRHHRGALREICAQAARVIEVVVGIDRRI